jgi:hypothetical protein
MAWTATTLAAVALVALMTPATASSTPVTYRYAISSPQFGTIGTFVRSADTVDGLDRARSQLRVVVRVLGIPVFREQADESETLRGGHLISFESRSTTNTKGMLVHGALRDGRLEITTPKGTKLAPVGTAAADPWSSRQLGPATVVTIKTGDIVNINTTGGETETLVVNGAPTLTRHYHVNTAAQPNWWEIWLDSRDVPVKFRSLEHGRTIEFTLLAAPRIGDVNPVAAGQ